MDEQSTDRSDLAFERCRRRSVQPMVRCFCGVLPLAVCPCALSKPARQVSAEAVEDLTHWKGCGALGGPWTPVDSPRWTRCLPPGYPLLIAGLLVFESAFVRSPRAPTNLGRNVYPGVQTIPSLAEASAENLTTVPLTVQVPRGAKRHALRGRALRPGHQHSGGVRRGSPPEC